MHKLYYLCVFSIGTLLLVSSGSVAALSDNIVISQVQLGSATSASHEYIELYNNSTEDTDITNWCLYYTSASSSLIGSKLVCFTADNDSVHLFLPTNAYLFLISNQLNSSMPGLGSDYIFSATLSGTAGHIRLIDSSGYEADKLGWGSTAASAEGLLPAKVPATGKVLGRKTIAAGLMQDTDINVDDFELINPRSSYQYGSIYEVQDMCSNLDGIQPKIPDGYISDGANNCIDPQIDLCLNITGVQESIPAIYKSNGSMCLLNLPAIKITELLPNAIGSDAGNEYIEVYNPTNESVDLVNYRLITKSDGREYLFPVNSILASGEYRAFSGDDIKFTLINTGSGVSLVSVDNQIIDETSDYDNPAEGESWSWFVDGWSYTVKPTPNQSNVLELPSSDIDELADALKPCASNQYRSEETGRCRLISNTSSQLVPCRVGQYRSEETNRCRSISSDANSYAPCDEGEVRNPETNRCKSTNAVLGASSLTACKAGQERNPATNRCRNISNIKKLDYAPEQVDGSSNSPIMLISIFTLGIIALAYAAWEWKVEINSLTRRLFGFIKSLYNH